MTKRPRFSRDTSLPQLSQPRIGLCASNMCGPDTSGLAHVEKVFNRAELHKRTIIGRWLLQRKAPSSFGRRRAGTSGKLRNATVLNILSTT